MNIVKIPRIVCHIDWSSWPRKPNDFPYDNGSNRDEMRPRAVYPGFGTTGPQSPFGTLHCLYFWVKWSSSFLWGVLYLSHHQYDKIIWYIYILIYICMSITGAYVEMFAYYLESNWVFFWCFAFLDHRIGDQSLGHQADTRGTWLWPCHWDGYGHGESKDVVLALRERWGLYTHWELNELGGSTYAFPCWTHFQTQPVQIFVDIYERNRMGPITV